MGHLIHISKRIDKRTRGWMVNRDLPSIADIKALFRMGHRPILMNVRFASGVPSAKGRFLPLATGSKRP